MSLYQEIRQSFFEMQLQHIKKRKKGLLTLKAARHILNNYKLMLHFESPVSFTQENCREFTLLFTDSSPAELVEWMESLFA